MEEDRVVEEVARLSGGGEEEEESQFTIKLLMRRPEGLLNVFLFFYFLGNSVDDNRE
jgi:hypothetical protein